MTSKMLWVVFAVILFVIVIAKTTKCSKGESFIGVPVPAGALKSTNEDPPYRAPWYPYEYGEAARVLTPSPSGGTVIAPPIGTDVIQTPDEILGSPFLQFPKQNLIPNVPWQWRTDNLYGENTFPYRYKPPSNTIYDYSHPYGPYPHVPLDMQIGDTHPLTRNSEPFTVEWNGSNVADEALPSWSGGLSGYSPAAQLGQFAPGQPIGNTRFYGSVSAYAPFPEINNPWEKVGIITPQDNPTNLILTLFRKPIAPLQDIFSYSIQDKDGNVIPLPTGLSYLANGDTIAAAAIPGYENKGPFVAKIFVNNKWVYV